MDVADGCSPTTPKTTYKKMTMMKSRQQMTSVHFLEREKQSQNKMHTCRFAREFTPDQRWAVLQPEGPRWLLELDERAGQVGAGNLPP